MGFQSIQELVDIAQDREERVWQIVLEQEEDDTQIPAGELLKKMISRWQVMLESVQVEEGKKSMGGLVGGDAAKIESVIGHAIIGSLVAKVISRALAASETNACMGRIVAAPTAGSCGVMPAVLSVVAEHLKASEEDIAKALFTSAGVGIVIARNASIAGADGGCQAECGSAAAMGAAAVAELITGKPKHVANAAALALKNLLGLVCDPVGGLVEVPCVKRNAFAAVHALTAAQMAIAGVESVIPVDEVIWAMHSIGRAIPEDLKETAKAGLAATPTGKQLAKSIQ